MARKSNTTTYGRFFPNMKWKPFGKKGRYNQDMIQGFIERIDAVNG